MQTTQNTKEDIAELSNVVEANGTFSFKQSFAY